MPDCLTESTKGPFSTFSDFYPFYLCEHSAPTTKLFHFVATFNVTIFLWQLLNAKVASTRLREMLSLRQIKIYTISSTRGIE